MADTELHEHIRITGDDQATRALGRIATAAGRVAGQFSGLGAAASALGGIAGVWKVAETIQEVDNLYQAVGRVKSITGVAAQNAHAMFNMFESAGIGLEPAEAILTNLARLSGKLGEGFSGSAEQARTLQQLMRRLGIDIKAGPEQRLLQMADAAQKGKLRINDLIAAFNIPRTQAASMMQMLQQGSASLKEIRDGALAGSAIIDEKALENFQQMTKIRRELGSAWGDLIGTLYKSLAPAVTSILIKIRDGFKAIEPIVESIGNFLTANMETVVALTKTYLALMLAAKAANVVTGTQMGIAGRGKQLFGMANGAMAARAATAGSMDYFAAKAANPGVGMFSKIGGPGIGLMATFVGRLGIIGAVIGLVIAAFLALKNNVLGLRDSLSSALGGLVGKLKDLFGSLLKVLGKLWEAIQPIVAALGGALLVALHAVIWVIDKVVTAMAFFAEALLALVNYMSDLRKGKHGTAGVVVGSMFTGLAGTIYDIYKHYNPDEAKKAADSTDRKTGEGKGNVINQDFRGSKFEIQNNFPEGIDGGRVAVAFGDEMARLGERRLDSGLRPLFSYR